MLWLRFPTSKPACFSCTATHCQHMPLPYTSESMRKFTKATHTHAPHKHILSAHSYTCVHTHLSNKRTDTTTCFWILTYTHTLCSSHLASSSSSIYFNLHKRSSPRSQQDMSCISTIPHLHVCMRAGTCKATEKHRKRVWTETQGKVEVGCISTLSETTVNKELLWYYDTHQPTQKHTHNPSNVFP